MLNIFRNFIHFFGKLKFHLIRKFLNFPIKRDIKRGLIIIQIDGLSFANLNLALEKRYMPNLKKIVLKDKLQVKKIYSGLPSNTPNFQKTLMFGDDDKIPGFRWYDKKNEKYFTFKNPETAEHIEKMVKNKGKTGILKDGVSYMNFFSGDADRSYLTMSKIFGTSLSLKISGFKIFMIIFLNFFNLFKVAYWIIKEIVRECLDLIYFYFNDLTQRTFIFFPFLRVFNNVILNEYITNGVCLEIICGTPRIYVTFNAYDELAHQRGPLSRSSMKILKLIDKSIAKIYRFAKKSSLRKYDIYILSDHGAAKSYPFYKLFGKDFKDVIMRYKEHIIEFKTSPTIKSATINIAILKKIQRLSEQGDIPKIFAKFFPLLRIDKGKKAKIYDKFSPKKINVISFGPISHIYFNEYKNKLNFETVNKEFPYLIIDILSHKGVSGIIAEDKENILFLMKHSYIKIRNNKIIDGEYTKLFFNEDIISDIEKIARLDNSGDLIVVSNYINNQVINFEDQMSCHGGVGFGQTEAFIIYPDFKKEYFMSINNPLDLHNYIKTQY